MLSLMMPMTELTLEPMPSKMVLTTGAMVVMTVPKAEIALAMIGAVWPTTVPTVLMTEDSTGSTDGSTCCTVPMMLETAGMTLEATVPSVDMTDPPKVLSGAIMPDRPAPMDESPPSLEVSPGSAEDSHWMPLPSLSLSRRRSPRWRGRTCR